MSAVRHRGHRSDAIQGALFALRREHKAHRCPHGVDHPSWCPVCAPHWETRMRHPSWPRER